MKTLNQYILFRTFIYSITFCILLITLLIFLVLGKTDDFMTVYILLSLTLAILGFIYVIKNLAKKQKPCYIFILILIVNIIPLQELFALQFKLRMDTNAELWKSRTTEEIPYTPNGSFVSYLPSKAAPIYRYCITVSSVQNEVPEIASKIYNGLAKTSISSFFQKGEITITATTPVIKDSIIKKEADGKTYKYLKVEFDYPSLAKYSNIFYKKESILPPPITQIYKVELKNE